MQPDDFLKTEIIVSGSAADALLLLNGRSGASGLQKTVKLHAHVNYHHKFGREEYHFPAITGGNALDAFDSLEKLRKQRAITDQQYSLLENIIELARQSSI